MGKLIDLTGKKFGRLTIIEWVENNKWRQSRWLCRCECGKKIVITSSSLKNGNTKSCGCLAIEIKTKHGHCCRNKTSKTYQIWHSMIQRCNNPNCKAYKNYGGRGIKVCKGWRKFEGFLQDMGEQPLNLTLDRVDNNGNYCKENCRWATQKEQRRNTRRNILITINGVTKCLIEWCEDRKLNYRTVCSRLRYGWTIEEALDIIPRKKKNSR